MSWLVWKQVVVKMADLAAITDNLKIVRDRLAAVSAARSTELKEIFPTPRLVAVSKTQPKECLIRAYRDGQRHFGENYVQELVEKALDSEMVESCPEIKYHFIGHLQKKNVNKLLSVTSKIHVVETIDSEALAKTLNEKLEKRDNLHLNVMVQVNTSGEQSKSGVDPEECVSLVRFVNSCCPNLKFVGLMTIGEYEPSGKKPNRDFTLLFNLREKVCLELELKREQVELSMGMSADFEEAIEMGSTNVRVGSVIFGPRQKKPVLPDP